MDVTKRNTLIAMAAILATGLAFLIANLDLPIVRNSFVYAKTAKNVIDHGFNPFPVIADPALFHGKPVGFSLLSVPFVLLFGANAGVKIASFLGTALFLCVAYVFFVRLNRRAGIDPRFIPLELALLFFNPLTMYQFWSAYPDSLFAGLVLLAFVLADAIAVDHERDTRGHIVLLGLVIYAAILTKLYGMILGLAIPAFLLLHVRSFLERSTYIKSKIALLVAVFGVLGVTLVLARLGMNPTLNFAVDFTAGGGGSGYAGYVRGLTDPSGEQLISSIIILIFALVLNFHFSLLFLLRGGTSKSGSRRGWLLAPTGFGGLFVLGLLPFPGTDFNMRFFIPLFPFVVVAMVGGMQNAKKGVLKRWMLGAYVVVACFLTLNYNLQPVYQRLLSFNEKVVEPVLDRRRRLDNLRIDQHLDFSRGVERINRLVEPGAVLYFASNYYGTAMHGVVENLGIRSGIEVRYVLTPSGIPRTERPVYLGSRPGASAVADRFAVTRVGPGLFRLVPLQVELVRPMRDAFDPGDVVPLRATAFASADTRVRRVEFLVDGVLVATDSEPPYEFNWHEAETGRHVATARVHDSEGNVALSAPVTVFVGIPALERAIAQSEDDAEEQADGSMDLNSSDLDLGEELVGLRFAEVPVPRGAEIRRAYIQLSAEEFDDDATEYWIHAELAGNAAAFAQVRLNISSRKRTLASVKWSPEPWNTAGERSEPQQTPDLSVLIHEVIAQPDWQAGNAMVFIITGSGERDAESYDGDSRATPRLYVEYPADGAKQETQEGNR